MKLTTKTAEETFAAGRQLAARLRGGEVILLSGDLGAGKTVFVQGLAAGLGISQNITSPTFVLFKPYPVKRGTVKQFVHADLYRLPEATNPTALGLGEYLGHPPAVVAIEWAEKLAGPPSGHIITVALKIKGTSRQLEIK